MQQTAEMANQEKTKNATTEEQPTKSLVDLFDFPVKFQQTCKILFSAKTVPESLDKKEEAFLARWMIPACLNNVDPDVKRINE